MECKTSDQFEDEGLDHYRRGDFASALHAFQDGGVRFPGDRDLLLGVAMAHLNLGDYVEACGILEDLSRRHGRGGDVLQGLAEAYLSLGRKDAALACVREALSGEPSPGLANRMGQVVYKHGLLQEAARCHALAVRWDRLSAPGYVGLGVCNHRLGRVRQAVGILQRAVALQPDNVEALSYLGNIFYDLEQTAMARELWSRIPLDSLGDPATLRRMQRLSGLPCDDPRRRAINGRLDAVLRAREPGVLSLLDRLAPAGDAA